MTLADRATADPAPEAGADRPGTSGRDLVVGGYRPGLDGLRSIATFAVLAYHADFTFVDGAFLGLSEFFTLSGFLITGLLLRTGERAGRIDLRTFWTRRFRRLMPGALAGLAVAVIFGATVAVPSQASVLPEHVVWAAANLANWCFIITGQSYADVFAAPSPLQHYWSLAVEEQFYLLMPLSLVLLRRFTSSLRTLAIVFGAAMLASAGWMVVLYRGGTSLDRVYYGTDTRAAEILAGVVLAIVLYQVPHVSRRALGWMGGLGVVGYALTIWAIVTIPLADGPIWRGGMLLYSLVSCVVIVGVVSGRGPLNTVLSWGPLPSIGRLTYGLYLYHWPVFLWLTEERTGLGKVPLFGLRLAVTGALAVASYHLLEMPIRSGARWVPGGRKLLVAAPAAIAIIVVASLVVVDGSGPDELATIRSDAGTFTPPVAPTDGVFDLLVITDRAGSAVVDRLQQVAADQDDVKVTRAKPFRCTKLVGPKGERVCANWAGEWKDLIAEHDPDTVLLYLDDWPRDELQRLGGRDEDPAALATEVLGSGLDLLGARGASILWSQSGASFAVQVGRSVQPFTVAMQTLVQRNRKLHTVPPELPDVAEVSPQRFRNESATILLESAAVNQRVDDAALPKVMVIGDSQARSLAYGLERWGVQRHRALVWNAGTEGCGLADDGTTHGFGDPQPVSAHCKEVRSLLSAHIEDFDPDIVVVLTSIWDIQDRKLASWDRFETMGDPAFDRYLTREFNGVVDDVTAKGAKVVWMNAPCSQYVPVPGQAGRLPDAFDTERVDAFNREILEPLAKREPAVELFDLDAALCPGGRYHEALDGIEHVRVDGLHFSIEGALWFADTYGDEILEMGGKDG